MFCAWLTCCAARLLLLSKALAAKNRSALSGTERKNRFFSTTRTGSSSLLLHKPATFFLPGSTLSFAILATLGQILELLVVEEELFSRGKNKILTAVHAL